MGGLQEKHAYRVLIGGRSILTSLQKVRCIILISLIVSLPLASRIGCGALISHISELIKAGYTWLLSSTCSEDELLDGR
jgi:hypothetical protein